MEDLECYKKYLSGDDDALGIIVERYNFCFSSSLPKKPSRKKVKVCIAAVNAVAKSQTALID